MSESKVGIPYAFHAKLADGSTDPLARVCPVCGEVCRVGKRSGKDASDAYAEHHARVHAGKPEADERAEVVAWVGTVNGRQVRVVRDKFGESCYCQEHLVAGFWATTLNDAALIYRAALMSTFKVESK